jgi:DNA (cytosine-5)-methyltransferase 1
MAAVRAATGASGLRAASMFAGAGGSSTGYRLAGYSVAYANELDRLAGDAYDLNRDARTVLDRRDVREVKGSEILRAAGGALDVLDGSPPCQDFSAAGQRDLDGENAMLYYEFVRLVGEVAPRAFVAENVTGFARGESRAKHFRPILAALRAHGYRVASRTLKASRLGVPQARERIILMGVREDEGLDPAFPVMGGVTTMADALPGVARVIRVPTKVSKVEQLHWRDAATLALPHRPLPTLLAAGLGGTDLSRIRAETAGGRERPLAVAELRAIATFPPDYKLPPGIALSRAWRMMGNSVPPLMARAWAETLRDALLARAAAA